MLSNMATWPSGKAGACKALIRGFESRRRLSCVYRAKTSEPRIWLSGTLVFKRKFIKVKHQNLDAVLAGVA